jgi:hypothetical protein
MLNEYNTEDVKILTNVDHQTPMEWCPTVSNSVANLLLAREGG